MKKVIKSLVIPVAVISCSDVEASSELGLELVYGKPSSILGGNYSREEYTKRKTNGNPYSFENLDILDIDTKNIEELNDIWITLENNKEKRISFINNPQGFFKKYNIDINKIFSENQITLLGIYYSENTRELVKGSRYDLLIEKLIKNGLLNKLQTRDYKTEIGNLLKRNSHIVKRLIDEAIDLELGALLSQNLSEDFIRGSFADELYIAADPAALVMVDIVAIANVAVAVSVGVLGHGGGGGGSCSSCHINSLFFDLNYSSDIALALNDKKFRENVELEYEEAQKAINSIATTYMDYFIDKSKLKLDANKKEAMEKVLKRIAMIGIS
ncbi:hypothetical protein [Agarivorans sp. 1_MG-2023]|uniref:hypothetical protein n=1 Tax=Agarivorans sp. 1_MG-2023 TaxID=3062634 RepID=UPI0026E31E29|nr:hypothetical protein [Agarivorans sp. 1_MG-2023]MDO6762973.1 hypothetical protein [Agarivorans sp. 1_MG-2023]